MKNTGVSIAAVLGGLCVIALLLFWGAALLAGSAGARNVTADLRVPSVVCVLVSAAVLIFHRRASGGRRPVLGVLNGIGLLIGLSSLVVTFLI